MVSTGKAIEMLETTTQNGSTKIVALMVGLVLLLGGTTLLTGCSDEHQPHGSADGRPAPEATGAQTDASDPVGRVVQANFELVDALADDEPERSRAAARQTLEAVETLPAEGDLEQPRRNMQDALQRLIEAEGLAQMRQHFEPFSTELTAIVRTHGAGDVAPVYRAMCPMVEGRRAYWLQPDRPITNPYWGEAMYRCGEITETLVNVEPQ
jgi:membrane fusion protein, copper/silver efflux system